MRTGNSLWFVLAAGTALMGCMLSIPGLPGGGSDAGSGSQGGSGSGQGSGSGSQGGGSGSASGVFVDGPNNEGGAAVAFDASGGLHVIHAGGNGGPVSYGYCASDCGTQSNWQFTTVPAATEGSFALAVDGQRPRLFTAAGPSVQYSACDQDCTHISGWTTTSIQATPATATPAYFGHGFAVVPGSGAAFAFGSSQASLAYVACLSNCTTASSWQPVAIPIPDGFQINRMLDAALAIDAQGRPRILYSFAGATPQGHSVNALAFAACDSGCTSPSAWSNLVLRDDAIFVRLQLWIDAHGHPRGGAMAGTVGTYGWCDAADCASNPQSWQAISLPLVGDGSMALDPQGNPRAVSYDGSGATPGVRYTWCSAGCESATAMWQQMVLPDSAMDAADPEATGAMAPQWSGSEAPILALDANGNAAIALGAARWPWEAKSLGNPPDKHGVFLWLPASTATP